MRVAAIQLSSQADVAENLLTIRGLLEEASRGGAALAVLPEGFAFLGLDGEKRRIQQPLDGSIVGFLRDEARRLSLAIVGGGFPERSPDDARPFNTSVAVDERGEVVGAYRKTHLFDVDLADGTSFRESRTTSPGETEVVTGLVGWSVGLSICFDLRFPEFFAREREAGAELLTVPAAFTKTTGAAHWHTLLRARAIETQCYVVAAAQTGVHPGGRETFGHSLVVDPWGRVIGERAEGPGVVLADLDAGYVADVRARMPLSRSSRS